MYNCTRYIEVLVYFLVVAAKSALLLPFLKIKRYFKIGFQVLEMASK